MTAIFNELRTVAKIAAEYQTSNVVAPVERQCLAQAEKIGEKASKSESPKFIQAIARFIVNRKMAFRSPKKSRPIKMPDYAKFYSDMAESKENKSIVNRLSQYIINKLEEARFARKSRPINYVSGFTEEYFTRAEQFKKAAK